MTATQQELSCRSGPKRNAIWSLDLLPLKLRVEGEIRRGVIALRSALAILSVLQIRIRVWLQPSRRARLVSAHRFNRATRFTDSYQGMALAMPGARQISTGFSPRGTASNSVPGYADECGNAPASATNPRLTGLFLIYSRICR